MMIFLGLKKVLFEFIYFLTLFVFFLTGFSLYTNKHALYHIIYQYQHSYHVVVDVELSRLGLWRDPKNPLGPSRKLKVNHRI